MNPEEEFIPFDNRPYVFDPACGRFCDVACEYDRKTRRTTSIHRPTGWPISEYLTADDLQAVADRCMKGDRPIGECFIEHVGERKLPPDFVEAIRNGPQVHYAGAEGSEWVQPTTFSQKPKGKRRGGVLKDSLLVQDATYEDSGAE